MVPCLQLPLIRLLTRLICTLLLIQAGIASYAQNTTIPVSLGHIPSDGLVLNQGWRFKAGDIPNGASPQLDDRQWSSLDPTKDIWDLPQIQQAGIGWIRMPITTGADLPPVMVHVFQSVASEMYLDGHLLYRFGTVSTNPNLVRAYNPLTAFILPLKPSSVHVLAIRFAVQPGLDNPRPIFRWEAAAIRLSLYPTTAISALNPFSLQALYLNTLRIGVGFILFILHMSLFLAYRRQRANLYAAGFYLLLLLAYLAKTSILLVHSIEARIVLFYCSHLDLLEPCMAVLTYYSLFNFRKGWFFWLVQLNVLVRIFLFDSDYNWISNLLSYHLLFEFLRISIVASQRKLLGAHIVRVGVLCNLIILILYSFLPLPLSVNVWFLHILNLAAFLCGPLTLSIWLALEHGWLSLQLITRLQEVENLSAQNLAQQQERQQLLAQQNEELERQVTQRTRELHQQADKLRELSETKSRFVTNITHEFRTPLSLIRVPVEKLLRENHFNRPLLLSVQRNTDQLLQLINQLLDLSKLEAGSMRISLTRGKTGCFLKLLLDAFQPMADHKSITLRYTTVGSDSERLFDADKLEKITYNLVSNALKFTEEGGQITVSFGADDTHARFTVSDTGRGIPADKLPHIFDRFYQADDSHTRAHEGTGIGLALVKELTELMDGTISVSSEVGIGTTVTIRIPMPLAEGHEQAVSLPVKELLSPTLTAIPLASPGSGNGKPLMLVVEDNIELRELIAGELANHARVLTAANGEEGWQLTQTELPDVVVSDVMMPQMDGYELTRHIKQNATTSHIAVVLLTAKAAHPSRIEGLQQGADDYLTKPFHFDELHLRLRNLLERQCKLREYYHRQLTIPDTPLQPREEDDLFLRQVYKQIESKLDDPEFSVEQLAEISNISRRTLHRKLTALTSLSANDVIRNYRLKRAADLLRAGHPVSETAYLVGFENPAYFSTVFKQVYQQTPSEFAAQ